LPKDVFFFTRDEDPPRFLELLSEEEFTFPLAALSSSVLLSLLPPPKQPHPIFDVDSVSLFACVDQFARERRR
jgi:hypothetical protein